MGKNALGAANRIIRKGILDSDSSCRLCGSRRNINYGKVHTTFMNYINDTIG